jgi:hypothetical protein
MRRRWNSRWPLAWPSSIFQSSPRLPTLNLSPQESFVSKPAGIAQAWTHVGWKREVVDVGVASYRPDERTVDSQSDIRNIIALNERDPEVLLGSHRFTTWKRRVARVGARLDEEAHRRHSIQPALNELGLPKRNPLRAVGIDGGYVKASDAPSRQEGWVEVMVGKSPPRAGNDEPHTQDTRATQFSRSDHQLRGGGWQSQLAADV